MFNKNLRYYRLKNNMTKKELASIVKVSPMAISHYESGDRRPSMDIIKELAKALNVKVTDFLRNRNDNLVFVHGEFRKNSKMTKNEQEYIRESVEEYLNRFFTVVEVLGGEILPDAPECHKLELTGDVEKDALYMRKYIGIAEFGPVGNLVELLENKGILVYFCNIDNDDFSGMNGLVNGRPYIIINANMSPERIRSTIVHEMAHFIFIWDEEMEESVVEKMATAIGGAFLLPRDDARRELGIHRSRITNDMTLICREYGISMYLLVKRANLCGIVSDSIAKSFYINAGKSGWRKNEPHWSEIEEPMLFLQLVFRAVCENEISIQKGAEILNKPYSYVAEQCFAKEG